MKFQHFPFPYVSSK